MFAHLKIQNIPSLLFLILDLQKCLKYLFLEVHRPLSYRNILIYFKLHVHVPTNKGETRICEFFVLNGCAEMAFTWKILQKSGRLRHPLPLQACQQSPQTLTNLSFSDKKNQKNQRLHYILHIFILNHDLYLKQLWNHKHSDNSFH